MKHLVDVFRAVKPVFTVIGFLGLFLFSSNAQATIFWEADTNQGLSVFPTLNLAPGIISVASDPLGKYGLVYKYHLTDTYTNLKERCESSGTKTPSGEFRMSYNTDYYIGWRAMWNPMPINPGWVALFQMHGYGVSGQGAPLVFRCINNDGYLSAQNNANGINVDFLKMPFKTNVWNTFVVHTFLSTNWNQGYIEIWYNGVLQTNVNGTTRWYGPTWDNVDGIWQDSYNKLKWGVYRSGAMCGKGDAVAYMSRARVASTYAEAADGLLAFFSVVATPASQTSGPVGTNVNYTVNVATNHGFAGNISFGLSGLPGNTSFSFNPPSLTGAASSTLTITTSNNTPLGDYTLNILATNGADVLSTPVTLIVGRNPASIVWNSTTSGTWDVVTTTNWYNPGAGDTDVFFNGDSVLFNDTPGVVTSVAIPSGVTVMPAAITNDSSVNNFTIGGAGNIGGTGRLVKLGASTWTLNTANSFSGGTTILNGIVKMGNASALGGSGGTVVVTNSGTLDLNGNNLGAEPILVSGWGAGSGGAIVSSAASPQYNALQHVTLAGDTAFGGPGNWLASGNPGRWDIRGSGTTLSTDGHPWNLYKVGSNQVSIVGVNVDADLANIDIQQGMLGFEAGSTSMGNPVDNLIVQAGATLEFYQGSAPVNSYTKQFVLYGGGATPCITNWSGGGSSTVSGLMILNGPCNIGVNGTSFTNNCVIIGGGGLIKGGAKPLVLGGQNTYTGDTMVSGGTMLLQGNGSISHSAVITVDAGATLDASGRSDTKLTLASGQTLTGNGAVSGIVRVGAGATLAPGTGIGVLTFSTNLMLSSDSTTVMEVNKSVSPSNDLAQVAGNVDYGGTLVITNVGVGPFLADDSFKLFNGASYSGAFTNIVPAIPGLNLAWDTSALTNGILTVVASSTPSPVFSGLTFTGDGLVLSGSNGVSGWPYYLLASTNLNAPMTNWTILATNVFDSEGKFIFTNSDGTNVPQMFYRLKLP